MKLFDGAQFMYELMGSYSVTNTVLVLILFTCCCWSAGLPYLWNI